ncbi:MAG: GTPase ObgE [Dehalococcoidia bacterium]|nr:GTPase ObgE [Dehalococcoidia bacterium]
MLDRVEISVKAGGGGNGAVTFRREKFVPYGGPDGGDGGIGGDVIIKADSDTATLTFFRGRRKYQAGNAGGGGSNKRRGKNGALLTLNVPPGTVVQEVTADGERVLLTDLSKHGQSVIVAKGGRGGQGNVHFSSATNQAPRLAEAGDPGEEKDLVLELKLIADAGIIGYPNVGKSSLLAAATAANPKIANYAFTTLEPMLGMVETAKERFILCEIPGLIEGAHLGKGLGHDFLRHAVRTRVMIHLLDGASDSPVDDMIAVNNELSQFDSSMSRKAQIVAVNKADREDVKSRKTEIRKIFMDAGITPRFISAATGEGVKELMDEVYELLEKHPAPELPKEATPVLRPQGEGLTAERIGEVVIIRSPGLERLVAGSDYRDPEVRRQLGNRITGARLRPIFERAGVRPGDKVRIGKFEWTW